MDLFVKTESFKKKTLDIPIKERTKYINQHKEWVVNLKNSGVRISSGYLINKSGSPGDGGILIFEAKSYDDAKCLINKDPMIKNELVNWKLSQLKIVAGNLIGQDN